MKWITILVFLAFSSQTKAQLNLPVAKDSLKIESSNTYRDVDHPKTIEILFFTSFGIGIRQRKDLSWLTRDLSFYTYLNPFDGIGRYNILRSWDDTAMYVLDYGVTGYETSVRAGMSLNNAFVDWSLNGFVGYSKRERIFKNKHILYTRDSSTGMIEYFNATTLERSNQPKESMFLYESWFGKKQILNSFRVGISPGVQLHLRKNRFIFSMNAHYDFGWNILVNTKGMAYVDIKDRPSNYFYNHPFHFYYAFGYKI